MMKWIIIPEKYLAYLRKKERRIPYSNYGENHFKPFFGVLFETEDLLYVTQVSSAKERHEKMKQNMDFYKLYQKSDNKLLAVVNLNYMFPVPKALVEDVDYSKMENYRKFKSTEEKNQYISLLKREIQLINELKLDDAAKKLYDIKNNHPDNSIAKRCVDFKGLEIIAKNYKENSDS